MSGSSSFCLTVFNELWPNAACWCFRCLIFFKCWLFVLVVCNYNQLSSASYLSPCVSSFLLPEDSNGPDRTSFKQQPIGVHMAGSIFETLYSWNVDQRWSWGFWSQICETHRHGISTETAVTEEVQNRPGSTGSHHCLNWISQKELKVRLRSSSTVLILNPLLTQQPAPINNRLEGPDQGRPSAMRLHSTS